MFRFFLKNRFANPRNPMEVGEPFPIRRIHVSAFCIRGIRFRPAVYSFRAAGSFGRVPRGTEFLFPGRCFHLTHVLNVI